MRLWESQCIKVAQSYPFEASSNARTDSVSTREQNWDPGDGKSEDGLRACGSRSKTLCHVAVTAPRFNRGMPLGGGLGSAGPMFRLAGLRAFPRFSASRSVPQVSNSLASGVLTSFSIYLVQLHIHATLSI
jgi:hypothetical protein